MADERSLKKIPAMKSIFSSYHGWRMRGRLRIWQRAGGKAGEEEGEGGPRGRGAGRTGKNLLSLFALLLEQDTLGFFLIFFGETEPPNFLFTPHTADQIDHLSTKSQPALTGLDPSTVAPEGFEWYR